VTDRFAQARHHATAARYGRGLERFIAGTQGTFAIQRPDTSEIEVSLRDLPGRPTSVVLRPAWLHTGE